MVNFIGGPSPDLYRGGADADQIAGGEGDDTLIGRGGNDTIRGNEGSDTLAGGIGNDRLFGGSGNDSVNGGDGNDILAGGGGDDLLRGGAGIDIATYADADSSVAVDLGLKGAQDTGGAGIDTIVGVENLRGTAFDDSLKGDRQANQIYGGGGSDDIQGFGGNDTLNGGKEADILTGGRGADTFQYDDLQSVGESPTGFITDLEGHKDFIDVSGVDADINTAGDQAFVLVDDFTGTAGEMRLEYVVEADTTAVLFDVDGDGTADYSLGILGKHDHFDNFIL